MSKVNSRTMWDIILYFGGGDNSHNLYDKPCDCGGCVGAPVELQELVHRHLHLLLRTALPLLLGRQPQPHLDLLLHR